MIKTPPRRGLLYIPIIPIRISKVEELSSKLQRFQDHLTRQFWMHVLLDFHSKISLEDFSPTSLNKVEALLPTSFCILFSFINGNVPCSKNIIIIEKSEESTMRHTSSGQANHFD